MGKHQIRAMGASRSAMGRILAFGGFVAVLASPGCKINPIGPLDFHNDKTIVQVWMRNSTTTPITTTFGTDTIPVGSSVFVRSHFSGMPNDERYSFDVLAHGQAVAGVSYQVLQFPASAERMQQVTINIKETGEGMYCAFTTDTLWIRVLCTDTLDQ